MTCRGSILAEQTQDNPRDTTGDSEFGSHLYRTGQERREVVALRGLLAVVHSVCGLTSLRLLRDSIGQS